MKFLIILICILAASCDDSLAQPNLSRNKNVPIIDRGHVKKIPDVKEFIQQKNRNLIRGPEYFENTCKVISPNASWPYGLVVVTVGQPRGSSGILLQPLFPEKVPAGQLRAHTVSVSFSKLLGASSKAHTDNQTVKLPNGDILISKDHCTWEPINSNTPEWMGESIEGEGGFKKGNRHASSFYLIRKNKLKLVGLQTGPVEYVSTLDFGKFEKGLYGYPQTITEEGKSHYWVGGHDRHELYACPYTGNIYLSCYVASGAYKKHAQENCMMILVSTDNAKTWKILKKFSFAPEEAMGAPIVMTSTPNKRLILFSGYGTEGTPRVYFSKAGSSGIPQFLGPFDVNVKDEKMKSIKFQFNKDDIDLHQNLAFFTSLYPVSVNKSGGESEFLASVHMKNTNNQMEAKVISIKIKDDNTVPSSSFITTIKAADSKTHSVVYGNFINAETWDASNPNQDAAISLFYWYEAPDSTTVTAKKAYTVRCMAFYKNKFTFPTYLSVNDNSTTGRTWKVRASPGDYMSGGFYFYQNSFNYLAQWVEHDGVKSNTVSFPLTRISEIMSKGF